MLTTLPSSSASRPTLPLRRRGAQPANRNALKHGLYARSNPPPLTHFVHTFRATLPVLECLPRALEQAILDVRLQMANLFATPPKENDLQSMLAWHRPILHLMGLFIRLQKALARFQQPQRLLQLVAAHALALIRYDFRSNGITRDADSFREKKNLSDFNSLLDDQNPSSQQSSFLFLAPHQRLLLAPLLPPSYGSPPQLCSSIGEGPGEGSGVSATPLPAGEGQGVRVGRPPAAPLPLLDAILWKLAHHARWQDLPSLAPPMLTCRRYYRRLYLSGRLYTIIKALYRDFLSNSGSSLETMANKGSFIINGNTLALQPGMEEGWHKRTALLLMQQAFQVSRCILNKKKPS